jgi:hypothetical protein
MRRTFLPLAGLLLANLVGCNCTMGKCDCDVPPPPCNHGIATATYRDLVPQPAPVKPEPIREMPRTAPDKE